MQHLPGVPPAGNQIALASTMPKNSRAEGASALPTARSEALERATTESAFPQTAHTVCPLKTPNSAVPELDTPCIIKERGTEARPSRPGAVPSHPENAFGEAW